MIKIYIASPYSIGDKQDNVYRQIKQAVELIELGFLVEWPLSSHYLDLYFPRPYDFWLDYDLKILKTCDCVLRLDGESKGADKEVEEALKHGIKVFYNVNDLVRWRDEV